MARYRLTNPPSVKALLRTALLAGMAAICGCAPNASTFPKLPKILMQAGDYAPNFRLLDTNGRSSSLSDYRGQVVLLNFWATWCAVCKSEMPMFEEIQSAFAGEPFTVLAVSIDQDAGAVKRYAAEQNFSFPIGLDLGHSAERAFKVQALPLSLLINKDGRLVYFGGRVDSRISTRVEGAADWNGAEVMQQIRSLL